MEWRVRVIESRLLDRVASGLDKSKFYLYLDIDDPLSLYVLLNYETIAHHLDCHIYLYLKRAHLAFLQSIGLVIQETYLINNEPLIQAALNAEIIHSPIEKGRLFHLSYLRQEHVYLALVLGYITIDNFIAVLFAGNSPIGIRALTDALSKKQYNYICNTNLFADSKNLILQDQIVVGDAKSGSSHNIFLHQLIRVRSLQENQPISEESINIDHILASSVSNAIVFNRLFGRTIKINLDLIATELRAFGFENPKLIEDIENHHYNPLP